MAENHHPDSFPPPAPPDLARWQATLLLTLTLCAFYWKLLFSSNFTWLYGDDSAFQVLPWLQFQAAEWAHGRIPLWDPHHWAGQPLIGQAQPGVANPLNWLLFLSTLINDTGWLRQSALHHYFFAIHFTGAACAYRCARSLGCLRLAAIPGALIFSLAGWFGECLWPQMLSSAMWAPLVFLFLIRALQGRSPLASSALSGFFLGLSFLGGHHQIPIFLATACLLAWLCVLPCRPRLALPFVGFLTLAALSSAVQTLPAQEYGRLAVRWAGTPEPIGWDTRVPYDIHQTHALLPEALPGIVRSGPGFRPETFLGLAACLLALTALATRWHRFDVRFFAALALFGILISIGSRGLLHPLLYSALPHFDKARNPSAAIFFTGLAAAMLAALGLDALLQSPWLRRLRRVQLLPALLLTLSFLILFLVEITHRPLPALVSTSDAHRMAALHSLSRHSDIAAFLRAQPGFPRVDVVPTHVPYNFGDWYGISQTGGYLASITQNIHAARLHETWNKRLLGIRFAVAKDPTPFHTTPVFTSSSGLKVFENPDVFPRAFSVHQTLHFPNPKDIPDKLFLNQDQLHLKVLLPTLPPPLQTCPTPDSIQILSYLPSEVRISANMGCQGMVILSDTFFPGWLASVDGRDTPIHEAYGFLRGVVVPGGLHTLEFRYRPRSVFLGAALTAFATAIATLLCRSLRRVASPPAA